VARSRGYSAADASSEAVGAGVDPEERGRGPRAGPPNTIEAEPAREKRPVSRYAPRRWRRDDLTVLETGRVEEHHTTLR